MTPTKSPLDGNRYRCEGCGRFTDPNDDFSNTTEKHILCENCVIKDNVSPLNERIEKLEERIKEAERLQIESIGKDKSTHMMACASLDSYEEALQLIRLAQQEMREQARVLINNSGYGDETEYEIYKEAIDDVLEIIGGAEGSKSGDDGKRNISPSSGQPSAESGSFVARKTADDKEKP